MLEKEENKEYLPIEGLASFRKATMDLMLGPNSKAAQEVCCVSRIMMELMSKTWGSFNNP